MKDSKFLKKSQQGELNAVPMYVNLAKRLEKENPDVAEMLRSMAADEGRHATVFKKLSGRTLKPNKLLGTAVPVLMRVIGKKKMFEIIAKQEYDAFDQYAPWVQKYPEIQSVRMDEKKHGDMAMKIKDLLSKPRK